MRQAALGSIASSLESWSCGPSQMPESERRRRRSPTACGLNSAPLRIDDLKGRVVLVEFWTFGCYNCRNVEPYMKQWYQKYADQGFVVIGVHSPEFTYEHDSEKVRRYLKDHDIRFPVSIDNDFSTWNRYGNRYWPAMYLIDKQG